MEHPLDPHKSYAYSPSPAVPHRNGFRQGSASRAYHAAPEPLCECISARR